MYFGEAASPFSFSLRLLWILPLTDLGDSSLSLSPLLAVNMTVLCHVTGLDVIMNDSGSFFLSKKEVEKVGGLPICFLPRLRVVSLYVEPGPPETIG